MPFLPCSTLVSYHSLACGHIYADGFTVRLQHPCGFVVGECLSARLFLCLAARKPRLSHRMRTLNESLFLIRACHSIYRMWNAWPKSWVHCSFWDRFNSSRIQQIKLFNSIHLVGTLPFFRSATFACATYFWGTALFGQSGMSSFLLFWQYCTLGCLIYVRSNTDHANHCCQIGFHLFITFEIMSHLCTRTYWNCFKCFLCVVCSKSLCACASLPVGITESLIAYPIICCR